MTMKKTSQYPANRHLERSPKRRQASGFSLIELMVAMVAGLLLLSGISGLIIQQSSSRQALDRSAAQIENGRYAMQVLQDDLHHAGFYGHYYKIDAPTSPTFPNACSLVAADLKTALPYAVQGWNAPLTLPTELAGCLSQDNHKPGTDILVVRRADTQTATVALALENEMYLQSTQADAKLAQAPPAGTAASASPFPLRDKDDIDFVKLRKFRVHVYFISPCSVPGGIGSTCQSTDDNGSPIPTLKRLELGLVSGALGFRTVSLVEGIENMQIDYGIDSHPDPDPTPAQDSDTDGAPNAYVANPNAVDTLNIVSAKVNLLSRQLTPTAGHTDSKIYDIGLAGTVGPFADQFKRHVFTELVRVENPSSRREK
jgi:type IV pilus assembly protein PilW